MEYSICVENLKADLTLDTENFSSKKIFKKLDVILGKKKNRSNLLKNTKKSLTLNTVIKTICLYIKNILPYLILKIYKKDRKKI